MIENVFELLVSIFAMYGLACLAFSTLAPLCQRISYFQLSLMFGCLEWISLVASGVMRCLKKF